MNGDGVARPDHGRRDPAAGTYACSTGSPRPACSTWRRSVPTIVAASSSRPATWTATAGPTCWWAKARADLVRAYSGATQAELASGYPYGPAYSGGVTVAAGDVNGDGQLDVITGTAVGGFVRVFNGTSVPEIVSGFPYGPLFTGGVYVAAGDISGDGRAEIVVAPRSGSDVMFIVDPADLSVRPLQPNVGPNGIAVAVGDLDLDGRADVFAAAGAGGVPLVRVLSGADGHEIAGGYAFTKPSAAACSSRRQPTLPPSGSRRRPARPSPQARPRRSPSPPAAAPWPITQTGACRPASRFTDNGDGTATLAGTPAAGTGGTFALTLTAATARLRHPGVHPGGQPGAGHHQRHATTFAVGTPGRSRSRPTGSPASDADASGALPAGRDVHRQRRRHGHAGRHAGRRDRRHLRPHLHRHQRRRRRTPTQNFTLTVNAGAGHHQRGHRRPSRVGAAGTFTVTTDRLPGGDRIVRVRRHAAGRRDVHRQRQRHRDADRHAGGGHRRRLRAHFHRGQRRRRAGDAGVHADGDTRRRRSPAPTRATFSVGARDSFTVTTTGFPRPTLTRPARPAGGRDLRRQRRRHRHAGRHAGGRQRRHLPAHLHGHQRRRRRRRAELHADGQLRRRRSPARTRPRSRSARRAPSRSRRTAGPRCRRCHVDRHAAGRGDASWTTATAPATLRGTPAAGTGGTYAVTFTAANGVVRHGTQAFTLTVNQAPAITSADQRDVHRRRGGTFTVTTTGLPAAGPDAERRAARGRDVRRQRRRHGDAQRHAGGGTGGDLSADLHRHQRRRRRRGPELHAHRERRRRPSPARKRRRSRSATPGTFTVTTSGMPDADVITRHGCAAGGRDLHGQRRRHGDARAARRRPAPAAPIRSVHGGQRRRPATARRASR